MQLLKMLRNLVALVVAFVGMSARAEENYTSHQLKLVALMAKVHSKEDVILGLLEEKSHAKHAGQLNEIASQLATEHKELRVLVDDYEKERNIIRYRFPEMNSDEERKYRRITVKSIEDIESEIGLDKQLDETKKKMRLHYGLFKEAKSKAHSISIVQEEELTKGVANKRAPAQVEAPKSKSIILVK